MRKRITSLLLTLAMLLSLLPAIGVTASAAEPEWTIVNSFEALHTAVKNKQQYIQLGRDIDTSSLHDGLAMNTNDLLTFENQDFVLDLNGKTLHLEMKIANPCFIQVVRGSLTIKDSSTAKTGAITGLFGAVKGGWIDHLIFVGNKGSLTLEGGTFSVKGVPFSDVLNAVCCIDASVTIKDGVKLSQPEHLGHGYNNHSYLDGQGYALYTEGNNKVIIDGGEFDGYVNLSGYQDTNGSVQINGGTFKKGVQVRYTAEENNSDPAVTVNGGTFEGNVYLQYWPWETSLYMPYRLNGGTFKGTVNLHTGYNSLSIGKTDKPESNPNIVRGLDQCFGYNAVVTPDGTFTGPDASTAVLKKTASGESYKMLLEGNESNPVQIIRDAWGMMESVTLGGNEINYAKDWNGTPVVIKNNEDHTITFKWKDLADELKTAGYRYDAQCMRYTSGDTTIHADQIPTGTEYSFTIQKGKDPKVYSFDLRLDLKKDSRPVNTFANAHIVRLVVVEAPVAPPSLTGQVYYTSGIVFGRSISTGTSNLPGELDSSKLRYQWQRSTNDGKWTDIDGATSGQYTPKPADMGENVRIRVKITANGYLGEIIGAAVKVSKADNNGYPAVIQLEAVKDSTGKYTGFKIKNFDSDCEYVYSTTDTPNWSANQISSATVTGLTSNTTYYVFARFKGTNTHAAGSIVSKNSIGLFDSVPLHYVLLEGYDSGNTIYIKKGESVTLKVSADPINANSWKKITFKERGIATGFITVNNAEIAESGTTATPFPNNHSITITGESTDTGTLIASYTSGTEGAYGTWNVVVYDDSTVAKALRLKDVYTYEDITLSVNDEAELPTNLPKLLPEDSGYHLEWRIVKTGVGTGGALYLTSDDNITLENGKIKPMKAHTGSASTRLELVAVKEGEPIKSFSQTSRFNVTVTAAPVIELTGLTVAPAKVNLELNATYQLSAVKEPVNAAGSLTWASDKPAVAEVDNTGKVTAKAQGTAIITVSCGDKKATCTVTVAHTHDTEAQPWVYMDPGTHTKTCTAGDNFKAEAHTFSAWKKVDDTNHSRTCTACKMTDGSVYTETAEHTWVWVVDQEAALNQPGKKHEECTGCHEKRRENTEIPALQDYAVTVSGGTATVAAGTSITRAMEGVEVTVTAQAPAGKHFVKWVVKAGGVTLANETSATTTFIMPAMDVAIEANFEKNASTGGGGGGSAGVTTYAITVQNSKNGGVTASHKSAAKDTAVTLTVTPDKGYVLDTLTVLDSKDKAVKLTEKNGKYTFTMPAGKVTVSAAFKAAAPASENPFTDVPSGAYYEDAVIWAVKKDITSGTSATTFNPDGSCTRAQAVTFLWRAAGSPETKSAAMPFTDVPAGSYFEKAVLWAVENGITKGTSDTTFSPDAFCTRAQIVTFLWRAGGSPAVSGNSAFSDVAADAYYAAAVAWAEKNGVTGGIGGGLFGSDNTCTRAQIVTFLHRAMK